MSIDIQGLYDSLLDASYRGITFYVIDTRQEVGRRIQRTLFPGKDGSNFQDLGVLDGPIRVTGLLSGDDYVAQAAKLRDAFRTAGNGHLVLPWIAPADVYLQGPASISFTQTELRIARFAATFVTDLTASAPTTDTLALLMASIDDQMTEAKAWLAATIAPVLPTLAALSYTTRWMSNAASMWTSLVQGGGSIDILNPAAMPAIATLASLLAGSGSTWGASAASAIAGVPQAIAAASVPTPLAAVGPGGSTATPPAADPAQTATLLLAAIPLLAASYSDPSPGPALSAGVQGIAISQAISAASDIVYVSQQDAIAWRNRLVTALDGVISATANLVGSNPSGIAPSWRSLTALRSAFMADINATIGRLPPVVTIQLPATMPAWLVAQYLADGQPGAVYGCYQDIIARNEISNPAIVAAGPIEVLA